MKRIPILLFPLISLFQVAAQTPDYGKMLVDIINNPSESVRREELKKIFSTNALTTPGLDPLAAVVTRWHDEYAPLDFHHAETNEYKRPAETVYVMHIYARKKDALMYQDFQLYLDPRPPHKLEKIAFIAEVAEPVNLPNGAIDQPETLAWLTRYADKLNKENDLYGSTLITKGNQTLFEKHYGFQNIEKKIPLTMNTRFNIASGGKMFTAIAIAQLVERGKVSLDAPVTQYLPDFPKPDKAAKVKVNHLLSHTSGIGQYWTGQNNPAVLTATTIDQHLRVVYDAGFTFEPGTQYEYCNSNFIVLGAIIEKVTGRSFYEYVGESIFKKVGMVNTNYPDLYADGTAVPYSRNGTAWKPSVSGKKGSSAGGAYSTLGDILNFSKALRTNTLVRRETFQAMTTPQNQGLGAAEDYGLGFILSRVGGEPSYGHGGTAKGVNFEFQYFPNLDVTLIMFCNQDNGAYDDLKKNIIKLITGHR